MDGPQVSVDQLIYTVGHLTVERDFWQTEAKAQRERAEQAEKALAALDKEPAPQTETAARLFDEGVAP